MAALAPEVVAAKPTARHAIGSICLSQWLGIEVNLGKGGLPSLSRKLNKAAGRYQRRRADCTATSTVAIGRDFAI